MTLRHFLHPCLRKRLRGAPLVTLLAALLLLLLCTQVHAQEETARDESSLDEDFLEFLGEWETASGEWLDPSELETLMPTEKHTDGQHKTAERGQN